MGVSEEGMISADGVYKAEVMGRWLRIACLGVNVDERRAQLSRMCRNYSTEEKLLLPRAAAST